MNGTSSKLHQVQARFFLIALQFSLKRNILTLKRLSIFLIFIFVVFILGVTYHHHEDCFICCANFNARAFLTQDTFQVFSNDCTISTVFIDKDIITLCTLTRTFSIRAPPA